MPGLAARGLQRTGYRIALCCILASMVAFSLWGSSIFDHLGGQVQRILDASLVHVGSINISILFVLKIAIFLVILIVLSRLLQSLILARALRHIRIAESQKFALGRFITYAFFLLGLLVGLQSLGLNLNSLVVVGGAIGVGVGLGLQNVVSNFVAGLILLIEQPIRIGDRIEVKETLGDVVRIAARATWIRTNDNIVIVVPNSDFIENSVTNLTANDPQVRVHLPVGVGYNSDVELVRTILLKAAAEHPSVLDDPKPDVMFTDYGDNSLNFVLRVWTIDHTHTPQILKSDLYFALFKLFAEHKVELPFPQRDLHIRSSDIALPFTPQAEAAAQQESIS